MGNLLNRARMTTATTGTGAVTLGTAVPGYFTFGEAGAANATVYSYTIEDGNDFEIGEGTYTASGTTFSRDTVTASKISGTAGTSKINLSGTAEIFITLRASDLGTAAGQNTGTSGANVPLLNGANTWSGAQVIQVSSNTPLRLDTVDDGSGVGPVLTLLRQSASPAVSDLIGGVYSYGTDSSGNNTVYGTALTQILDPTDGSEDGKWVIQTVVNGTLGSRLHVAAGIWGDGATGGDQGAGTANFSGLFVNGSGVYAAGGTDILVADGGTGRSSHTAYAVLCGGTTTTGAQQSIASVGTSGQVLTSNGAGALPTFQDASSGGQPIPTSSTFPVGMAAFLDNNSTTNVNNGATTSGSNLEIPTFIHSQISGSNVSALLNIGGSQTGTWRNISGVALGVGSVASGARLGWWVRTA